MKWFRYGGLGLAVLGLAGCEDKAGESGPEKPVVQQSARLEAFESCKALEDYIEDTAVLQMRTQLEAQRDGRGGWGGIGFEDGGGMPPASPTTGGENSGGTPPPRDHTGTNNQVAGVHEADFVQNDGTRLFLLSGQKLYTTRTWPAESLSLAGSLTIEGWPREMLLDEKNRLVIFSAVYEPLPPFLGDKAGAPIACSPLYCGYSYSNTTKVTVVDVSDLAAPTVVDQTYLPGQYDNSRRVGGAVRLVLRDNFRWPNGVQHYVPYSPDHKDNPEKLAADVALLIEQNTLLIRKQTLAQWLPRGRRVGQDGARELAYQCQDFHRVNASTKLGLVTVASLDLDAPQKDPGRTSIVAEPGEVYASAESLYIASGHWWWWPEVGQKDHTYVHKFDTREPSKAIYVGSGTVEGHVINQFAMDEHQGVLRLATTTTERLAPTVQQPWGPIRTTSRVTLLGAQDGQLVTLGRTEELAEDERIQSARFVGNRGYVVTFRQIDPLFTFDLSNPAQPRKVGELKVPGFSTYLHPLDENHLLGLGVHVPESGDWRQRAMKLTIFDVSDLAHPTEKYTQLVGTAYGWSEAAFEHKAFNWFPAKKLLAIPFTDWIPSNTHDYWGTFISELRVFRVDTATGITPVGALSMADVYRNQNAYDWSWYWTPYVRRSVMADDFVYAISDAGVRVARADSLQTPVATALLPRQTPTP
jgi:hypothetical protein